MLAVLIGGAAVDQRRAAFAADLTIVANIARELGRVGDTRGRICQAIRDLTMADYVLLTQPDEHAQPTITAALPSGAAHDSADGALGLDRHTPSRSGSQAALDALLADGKMAPGLRQLSTGEWSSLSR